MRQTGILILATTLVSVCIVALPLFAQRSQTAKETKVDVLKEKLDKKVDFVACGDSRPAKKT